MQYVILDLEWNTAYARSRECYVNEIIEFGAVKLNENREVVDSFSSFVHPQIGKRINSRVKNLTSITNQDVADADIYQTVEKQFSDWVGDPSETVLMSWGDMDIRTLIDNNKYFHDDPHIPFVYYYLDLQAYFMKQKGLPKAKQIGLSNAADLIDEDPEQFVHHRALGDSELTAVCFNAVYDEESFEESVIECDDDFYKRILFHPYVIKTLNDPLVDHDELACKCLECGKSAFVRNDWKFSGNAFRAVMECPECHNKYRVSVQFKRMYDQIAIKKNVCQLKKPKKKIK